MAEKIKVDLGVDEYDNDYSLDITGAPHTLIGGTTGSGKSVLLHNIITSLIYNYRSSQVHIYLGDPKQVEFARYKRAPQVKGIATTLGDHDSMLEMLVEEMERRFALMRECVDSRGFMVDNVIGERVFQNQGNVIQEEDFPNIIVIIDEYGNLILDKLAGKRMNENIIRLAQKARAAGINLVLATQHPTVEIVNTQIKANCPVRVAMKVMSHKNSMVIIDEPGAENLDGHGEMFVNTHYELIRDGGKIYRKLIKIQTNNIDKSDIEDQIDWSRVHELSYH